MTADKVFVREIVDGIEPNDTMGRYVEPNPKHPAKFSNEIIVQGWRAIERHGIPGRLVLDPCAGIGRVHSLGDLAIDVPGAQRLVTVSVELEAEWAAQTVVDYPGVEAYVGDSTKLPRKWSERFACVFTSPVYGNRMSDSHANADSCKACAGFGVVRIHPDRGEVAFKRKPGPTANIVCSKCKGDGRSTRRSYTHDLGHSLTEGNVGRHYFWQQEYRDLQWALWREVARVLKDPTDDNDGGLWLLNVKDFDRTVKTGQDPERMRVAYWHLRVAKSLGFERIETIRMPHRGLRHGANRHRAPNELLYVLRKVA